MPCKNYILKIFFRKTNMTSTEFIRQEEDASHILLHKRRNLLPSFFAYMHQTQILLVLTIPDYKIPVHPLFILILNLR
jgi:hypothetical protein